MGNYSFKKINYQNFINIFENVSDNLEFINSIVKIFETFPNQVLWLLKDENNFKLYDVILEKDIETGKKKISTFIKKFEANQLTPYDYVKALKSEN